MASPHRVVVTGMGQVSSLGTTLESFEAAVRSGTPSISRIEGLDAPGFADPIGARIPDWDARAWMPAGTLKTSWTVTHYAYAAAHMAFEAAGLERIDRPRGGIYVGTGFGGQGSTEHTYREIFEEAGKRPRPTSIPNGMYNASAGFLATQFRLKGPNLTVVTACASATHAIGQALLALRSGHLDLILCGGTDAPLTPINMSSWNVMRVLSPGGDDPSRACRPFDVSRSGLVVGEGAGMLVLETLEHAEARGAEVLAEVVGYGASADAGHITKPDEDGVSRCIELALEDAGMEPADLGYVNGHGTGTKLNDLTEARALHRVFGDRSADLLVSSTKAVHGHVMGASGGLEAIATIQALGSGLFPPTANLTEVDPDLPPIDFIKGEARAADVGAAMSTSYGFGGNNAAIVLARP